MAPIAPDSQDSSPSAPSGGGFSSTSNALMWSLLIGGVLLVCFAGSIGYMLVPKQRHGPNSYGWSPDSVREIAFVVRCLGFMAFAAGLVERLVIQIDKTKV